MNNSLKRQRPLAIILIMCLLMSLFQLNYYSASAATENDTVEVIVGAENLHLSLSSPGLDKSYEAMTGQNGIAHFDDLYTYLGSQLHWDGSVPEAPEGSEEPAGEEPYEPPVKYIVISYDVNYADSSAIEKEMKPDGNGRYRGSKGQFILKMNSETEVKEEDSKTAEGADIPIYLWNESVSITTPDAVNFLKGTVKAYGYSDNPSAATATEGIQVYSTDDDKNEPCGSTSGADGSFEFFPYIEDKSFDDDERKIGVAETLYYYGYEKTIKEFKADDNSTIILKEKFKASEGDFDYGEGIKFGYVKEPGTYEIKAGEGYTISLSANGEFAESVSVSIDENGNVPNLYLKNEAGDISQPFDGKKILKLDQEGPVISEVTGVSETEGADITFNAFGIFTNTDADLTLRIKVTDNGCGVEKLYMEGTNPDDSVVKYDAITNSKGDGEMTSTFLVPSAEELLQQKLTVIAVDYLGNASEFMLIRETEDSSTITIEKNKPELTDISQSGKISSHGWYNDAVTFGFATIDFESGLHTVSAKINGHSMINETFPDKRENDAKEYSFTLTRDLISQLENDDGTYEVSVSVRDNSGNISEEAVTVKADIVAPHVSLSGAEEGAYLQQAPNIIISNDEKYYDEEGAAIYVTIYRNGLKVADKVYDKASSASLSSELASDGFYTVTAYAMDAADNKSNTVEVSFCVDGTAPTISAGGVIGATPSEYGWYNTPLEYSLSVSDATSGVSVTSVTINGIPAEFSGSVVYITKEIIEEAINDDGTYLLVVTVTDKAGNTSTYEELLKIDIVAPELTLSGIEEDKHYNQNPTLVIDNNEKHYDEEGAYTEVIVTCDGDVILSKVYDKENHIELSSFNRDGDYEITVKARDAALNFAEEKVIKFVKDTTAPVITISGAEQDQYYNTERTITVQVDERYYDTNDVKVEVVRNLNGDHNENFTWENKDKRSICSATYSNTGTYTVRVSATDEAGNKAESKSLTFTVDTVAPQVEISGITDGAIYSYDDVVAPVITYSDDYFASKTLTLTRAGRNHSLSYSDSGSRISFADFEKVRENDGLYHLEITVVDKAGNSTTREVDFAVNRFGSLFTFPDELNNINGKYHKSIENDLVIEERNISELTESINEIKKDGKEMAGETETRFTGTQDGYNYYDHVFSAGSFSEEGVYTINVLSEDEAGNNMESQEFAGQVKFYVDRTAPVINTTGLSESIVKAESLTISAVATDNLAPVELYASVNGEDMDVKTTEDGTITFDVKEGLSQEVQITAVDAAGNEEIMAKTISVTPNSFLYFVIRYKAFLIGAAIIIAAAAAALIYRKKKGSMKTEENNE